jgi:antitoxin (DNA-binding transcriptional repressor) of toxin-antitoxin stability system
MSTHSLAEAKEHLAELIDRAEKGEEVVITRDGRPVAEIRKALATGVRQQAISPPWHTRQEMLDWLEKTRIVPERPIEDSATLVSRMRDEGDERLLGH